jgi:hypothetical protein
MPGGNMPGGASGAPGGSNPVRVAVIGSPQTGDEQVGDLDRVLDGSMVIFDGRILEEQQRARDARRGSESGAEGSVYGEESEGGSGATDVGEDGGMGGESGDGDSTIEDGGPADTSGLERPMPQGGAGKEATGSAPEGIPSGDDDDIVARQLREAAETESDPVLREKLWEEYRRYKEGTSR